MVTQEVQTQEKSAIAYRQLSVNSYDSTLQQAYEQFLGTGNGPCANCHYEDSSIPHGSFNLSTQPINTLPTVEQGLLDLFADTSKFDVALSNVTDPSNTSHPIKLSGDDKAVFEQLIAELRYDLAEYSNAAPTASINYQQDQLVVDLVADASDIEQANLQYVWDIEGQVYKGMQISHSFQSGGIKEVTLMVADGKGKVTTMQGNIDLGDINLPPTAAFDFVATQLAFSFDSTDSVDPNNDNLTYSWDFGDGQTGNIQQPNHTYAQAGSYEVTLTVSDGQLSASTSQTVTAKLELNQAPTAMFSYSQQGQTLTLNASMSQDPDGDELSYFWDINNDQISDYQGELVTVPVADLSSLTVVLTVRDSAGLDASSQKFIMLTQSDTANTAPNAVISVIEMGSQTFQFGRRYDAQTAADNLSYSWDFGNGQQAEGAKVDMTFEVGQQYEVVLTVSDGQLTAQRSYPIDTDLPPVPTGNGEKLYDELGCAACHDKDGERGKAVSDGIRAKIDINKYLNGDSAYQKILKTMPPQNPASCGKQCAADIEAFMLQWPYEEAPTYSCNVSNNELIYGPRQMRLLTAQEYANTVKDLYG